jgi:thiol-disulfide isomerase/thioredoxin
VKRLLLVLALLLAGCGATPAPATPAAAPAAPAPVAAATSTTLNFSGTTLDGATFDASSLAGKPAILWFWAPWCATCAGEAQTISSIRDKYGDQLGILGIAGMGDNKAMHEFVSDLDVAAVPHLDDQAGKVWKRFGITEQSTYVLLDRAGKIVRTGYLDSLQLTTEVKTLVA